MAVRELINAIVGYGQVVVGDRFVGRQDLLDIIVPTFFVHPIGGNISLSGLPRVGKTSLMKQAEYIYNKSSQYNPKHIICYIDLNARCRGQSIAVIFLYMFSSALETIKKKRNLYPGVISDYTVEELETYVTRMYKEQSSDLKLNPNFSGICDKFLEQCESDGIKLRFILDEFDSTHSSFYNEDGELDVAAINAFYGRLREYVTHGFYNIKVAIISRNALSEIEPPGVESKLSGVCKQIPVRLFNYKDIKEYWDRLKTFDSDDIITADYIKDVELYAGRYPYWLDLVNECYLQDILQNSSYSIQDISHTMNVQYDTVLKMLDKSCYLEAELVSLKSILIQVLIGPRFNVKQNDVDKLLSYGIIERVRDSCEIKYRAVSEYFYEYLKIAALDIPIWSQISRFEILMRGLIKIYINECPDWENKMSINQKGIYNVISQEKAKSKRIFGGLASDNIIDYLHMSHYFPAFVKPGWQWFKHIFTSYERVEECEKSFIVLTNVRNPIAHFNAGFLSDEEILKASNIANISIAQIESFFKKNHVEIV